MWNDKGVSFVQNICHWSNDDNSRRERKLLGYKLFVKKNGQWILAYLIPARKLTQFRKEKRIRD